MPKFTALVHVEESSKGVEETLSSAKIANDILVVLDSTDNKLRHDLRKCGARIKTTIPGVSPGAYAMDAYYEWLLILRPGETLSEDAIRQLTGWKKEKRDQTGGYRLRLLRNGKPFEAFRLVNRAAINWTGELPPEPTESEELSLAA